MTASDSLAELEFFFDFASPNCYALLGQLKSFCEARGAALKYSPIFLGGLFKMTLDSALPKGSLEYDYMARNLERFSRTTRIPFKFSHERFPVNSLKALRGYYYAEKQHCENHYVRRVFESCWGLDEDITGADVLRKIAGELELKADDYLQFIEREDTKQRLKDDTQYAFYRGVFGAPTVFFRNEMIWGTPGEVLWNLYNLR